MNDNTLKLVEIIVSAGLTLITSGSAAIEKINGLLSSSRKSGEPISLEVLEQLASETRAASDTAAAALAEAKARGA